MEHSHCFNPLAWPGFCQADEGSEVTGPRFTYKGSMQCIRVGLIGFGFGGRVFQAKTIEAVEGLELATIVQRTGDEAALDYPHAKIVRSVEELLADRSIRLVVVSSPNATHLPIARQCLQADRDVVIDKPFALSSKEAAELIELARSRGRLLSVYQNRRWDGDFLTVRKLLEGDRVGRLVRFESNYDRFRLLPRLHAWRENGGPGGGVLFDLGAHLVDQALVLFGVPQAIWASVRMEREGAMSDDAFDLYLQYPAVGLSVWLRATCLARAPGPRFTLQGTLGTFRKFGMDIQEGLLLAGDNFSSKPWGVEGQEHWGTLTLDEGGDAVSSRIPTEPGDYRGYYINIRDAMHGHAALEVTPLQAWRTMRVLEIALESSHSGCSVACDWSFEP
jgi:scyllo-inositol 2-dehydrogenase (NADP+)